MDGGGEGGGRRRRQIGIRDRLPGINTVVHVDGPETELGGHARFTLEVGERIRIETPGGGGFGVRE